MVRHVTNNNVMWLSNYDVVNTVNVHHNMVLSNNEHKYLLLSYLKFLF